MNSNDFSIPVHIEERYGLRRDGEAIRIGVPLPRSLVRDAADVVVTDAAGASLPHQAAPLAFWSDRSIKWLLVDAVATVEANERTALFVRPARASIANRRAYVATLRPTSGEEGIEIDTGVAQFALSAKHPGMFTSVVVEGSSVLQDCGSYVRLIHESGAEFEPAIERLILEERGPVRATVLAEGSFRRAGRNSPVRFRSRAVFIAGSAVVRLDFQVRNARAALHAGGLWDLGDRGSWFIRDLTIALQPRNAANSLRWYTESPAEERETSAGNWALYQDSSGGKNWDSPNHIDHKSKPTVAFRGYRVRGDAAGHESDLCSGERAEPCLAVESADGWIAASTKHFWQNFPKALRWNDGVLGIGLFPGESPKGFELQGGEQKRHTILFEFGAVNRLPRIAELQHPVAVAVDPQWVETSHAILWFSASSQEDDRRYADYIQQVIEGPNSFFAKREIIDEYGWRNFGDLYADHEAVHHRGPKPFVSHYNNQYDFIYGALLQGLRSGDTRWHELMGDLARHVIDIDIYHTQHDKAAFNGGLFWHTDHYKSAATCTHRTYSRSNGGAGYGGGPSNEHNYTSGLLHYYYLSGDAEAASAVLELAEWVLAMDDGSRGIFSLFDSAPTGNASRTLEAGYHNPGRGAGNSVNALLDGFTLSGERRFFLKAEELIERCISPSDDVSVLQLDEPERRWSYLVFLQVLTKYLAVKSEMGDLDYGFHYARESLLLYAGWMLDHEVPYKDVLHKVELPTETWPAHDVRKSHVLHVAASYCEEGRRARIEERARFFFERCLKDLLSFPTSHFTRPLVILCVYGSIDSYFRRFASPTASWHPHNYKFAPRPAFTPQRARLRSAMGTKLRIAGEELARVIRGALLMVWLRIGGRR